MSSVIDILEKRVIAATELIASLREKVARLERESAASRVESQANTARTLPPSGNPTPIIAELERLRAERVVVRDRIRGLIKEFDRVNR